MRSMTIQDIKPKATKKKKAEAQPQPEKPKKEVLVRFKYDQTVVGAVKQLTGAYFRKQDKCWIVPDPSDQGYIDLHTLAQQYDFHITDSLFKKMQEAWGRICQK